MARMVDLILRGVQFLLTLLIMALTGNMIADAVSGNPSVVNYSMFVAVFAMLSLFFLIFVAFKGADFGPVPLALDALNVLFFFCGGVALAAELGAHSCSNRDYTRSNKVTNGEPDTAGRCREAQAITAFMWFAFAAFVASLFFSFQSSRNIGSGLRFRKGAPAMTQV